MYNIYMYYVLTILAEAHMPKSSTQGGGRPLAVPRDEAPVRKNYRLHQSKLDLARRLLGTKTETETIERALEMVGFGARLAAGTERAQGRAWNDVVGEMERLAESVAEE